MCKTGEVLVHLPPASANGQSKTVHLYLDVNGVM